MLAALAKATDESVLAELNVVRCDPKAYAAHLEPRLARFEDKVYTIPGKPVMVTVEGAAAVEDCIACLKSTAPLPPLERVSPGLSAAAQEHANDLARSGGSGHDGSDGSSPFDRMNRHGKWSGGAAENICCGKGTARDHCVQLLIDDGVSSRGHRMNILNKDFKVLGVAYGPHDEVQVTTFASAYEEGAAGGKVTPAAVAAKAPSVPSVKAPASPPVPASASKPRPPAGGRIDVKTSIVTQGNKKITTRTTITTEADGSTSTFVETMEEIVS